MPKVSVIIPSYNSASYLPETIKSIVEQEFTSIEIIIVDDGSTDNTKEYIDNLNMKNLKYLYNENSGGPAIPRNNGIKAAEGDYIALFDSDDIMLPHKIEKSIKFLEKAPQLGMVFTDFIKFQDGGDPYDYPFLKDYPKFLSMKKLDIGDDCFIINKSNAHQALFYENYIGTSGVMMPRSVFTNVGYFDESLKNSDDRDMWFRLTKHFDIGFISIIGHKYRKRQGSIQSRGVSVAENRIKVLRKNLPYQENKSLIKQGNKLISENLNSIGVQLRKTGNRKEARQYYISSFRTQFNYNALRGYLITFLPQKKNR